MTSLLLMATPLKNLIGKLAVLTADQVTHILRIDKSVRELKRTVERIRAMKGNVEEFQWTSSHEKAWKLLLEEVVSTLYSTDNLLDGISLDLIKYRSKLSQNSTKEGEKDVRDMVLGTYNAKLANKVNNRVKKLDKLGRNMEALFTVEMSSLGCKKILDSRPYRSVVDKKSVVGRERETKEIVDMVLGDQGSDISVIPIVGVAGIGKTTLAQMTYNDDRLGDDFSLKIWASVGINHDTISITKSIIESAFGETCDLSNIDSIQTKLQKLIKGQKFLLVLDDYWSENYEDWDLLTCPFRVGAKGSKILVTTRSTTVCQIVRTVSSSYCLGTLGDEYCSEIILKRAHSDDLQLREIGSKIARKCKGVPLIAKVIGTTLHFKSDPTEWENILYNEIWDLREIRNQIFPVLALSYYRLPPELKYCLAYCSVFPKDHKFEMNELVVLWVAEGLIVPMDNIRLEDVACSYFKKLLSQSFFRPSVASEQNIYQIDDIVLTMIRFITGDLFLCQEDERLIDEEAVLSKQTRHMSVHRNSVENMVQKSLFKKNLRTLIVRHESEDANPTKVSYDFLSEMKYARVLNLNCTGLDEVPASIGGMKSLRYLNLSENPFSKLPNSIKNPMGLETLKLEKCYELTDWPSGMNNMVSLKHLHYTVGQFTKMPFELGKLVNLQTLSAFIVGKGKGHGIGELKNLKLLRGSICITNLENVKGVDEAKQASLDSKPFLDKIELVWSESIHKTDETLILGGLHPHVNLKELWMTNYSGKQFPDWLNQLPKLSTIHLLSCNESAILGLLRNLQHLKSLVIENMPNWSTVDPEFSGFPCLESLRIADMSDLTSWGVFQGSRFPRLRSLQIDNCRQLTDLPSLIDTEFLECLEIRGCPRILSLPIDGLPKSVKKLSIYNSNRLKHTCSVGELDYDKIRLVEKITIDDEPLHIIQSPSLRSIVFPDPEPSSKESSE